MQFGNSLECASNVACVDSTPQNYTCYTLPHFLLLPTQKTDPGHEVVEHPEVFDYQSKLVKTILCLCAGFT